MRIADTDRFAKCVVLAALSALIAPAHADGQLRLQLTNQVVQESAGLLPGWISVEATPCPTQDLWVAIGHSDATELRVTNAVLLTADNCRVAFDLQPVWDSVVDGRQRVELTATAAGYNGASNHLDVLHVGGATRSIEFKHDALLQQFEPSKVFSPLTGPTPINFSSCLLREDQDEIYILVNRTSYSAYPAIQVYQTNGTYVRETRLPGFDDAEGFCLISATNNLYAIVEEGVEDRMTVLTITTNDLAVNRGSGTSYALSLPFGKVLNKGLEGIVYDEINDSFYAIQEQSPMAIYRIVVDGSNASVDVLFDAQAVFAGLATDLSDLTFDPRTGRLLILSDESKRIFECGLDGTIFSQRDIVATQPEGIYFANDRKRLYITGEPTELQILTRKPLLFDSAEGSNRVIELDMSFPADEPISAQIDAIDRTAVAGEDYASPTGSVTFAAGSTVVAFTMPILVTTGALETTESFGLSLTLSNALASAGALVDADVQILGDPIDVQVASQYGTPSPPRGTQTLIYGQSYNLHIPDSPVVQGGVTRFVCTGWLGSGSVADQGTATATGDIPITNASSITWLWETNFWLSAGADAGGNVTGGNAWFDPGSTAVVQAVSDPFSDFARWTGDVPASEVSNALLNITLDRPKNIFARFTVQATSNGIPYSWMTTYYSLTNDLEALSRMDTDGDGHTALQEYLADTSPTDPNQFLAIAVLRLRTSYPYAQLEFTGSPNRLHDVYRYLVLTNTTSVTRIATGVSGRRPSANRINDPSFSPPKAAYYRINARNP